VTPFVKWIFQEIKTCFQGKMQKLFGLFQKLKHASKVKFQNAKTK
jgi:hypothetical protein